MSEPWPTVQPCSTAWWPTVTSSASVSGMPMSVCSRQPSWTLVRAPSVIQSLSPRSTAPYQTLLPSAMRTRPITWALSATQAVGSIWGASSPIW